MAEPDKPRIILQTKRYRVIAKGRPPFEGNPRSDEISIEELRNNRMDEPYWGPVHCLWDTASGMSQDQRMMLAMFAELASQQPPENKLRDMLGWLLIEASGRATSDVTMQVGDLPFDGREGHVGIRLTPAMLAELIMLFPGTTDPGVLLAKLLERAAQELL